MAVKHDLGVQHHGLVDEITYMKITCMSHRIPARGSIALCVQCASCDFNVAMKDSEHTMYHVTV